MRSDLIELTVSDLCTLLARVTAHRKLAEALKDQTAVNDADWLINQLDRELKCRC